MGKPMDEPIRYAIVGLGRSGWNIHIEQLRGRSDAKIVAVVDPLTDRCTEAEKEFGCCAYSSITPMLKQKDVEVVIIATPSIMHGSDTKTALRAGKHVVCEKPMATSASEAESMIITARKARRHLIVHHNYRFFPEFLQLKELVDSSAIGKVFHIRNTITNFVRRNDWQTLARNGGGLLNNHGSHFIDQILLLAGGKVTQVMSDLRRIASLGDVEDHIKAILRFDNGIVADMEISMAQNIAMPPPKWVIAGDRGTITVDGEKEIIIRSFDPAKLAKLKVIDGAAPNRVYGNDEQIDWRETRVKIAPRPLDAFYSHVFDIIRRGAKSKVQMDSAREVVRVADMIRKASGVRTKTRKTRPKPKRLSEAL